MVSSTSEATSSITRFNPQPSAISLQPSAFSPQPKQRFAHFPASAAVSRFHLLAPSSALTINQTVNQNFPGARSATFLNANPRWVHHKAEVRAVGRISPFTEEIISPYGREFLRPIRLEPFLLPRHPWRMISILSLFHTFEHFN